MPHAESGAVVGSVLSAIHALAWSIYVGGAVCMELVLRYAQQFMKPSQTAYVCEFSGKRYRWWSCVCLAVLLVTGVLMALRSGVTSTLYVSVLVLLGGLWVVQVALLALLSFRIHPDMHARLLPSMSAEEVQHERQRVGVAIVQMDRTLRTELVVLLFAVLAGAALHMSRLAGG